MQELTTSTIETQIPRLVGINVDALMLDAGD